MDYKYSLQHAMAARLSPKTRLMWDAMVTELLKTKFKDGKFVTLKRGRHLRLHNQFGDPIAYVCSAADVYNPANIRETSLHLYLLDKPQLMKRTSMLREIIRTMDTAASKQGLIVYAKEVKITDRKFLELSVCNHADTPLMAPECISVSLSI